MSSTDRLNTALAGRYKIEKQLGQGGMATVYLAHDEKHDRKVAVKVLKPELAAVLGAERFVVEIKTTAALQHPHILPLFDSGTADGFLYYVMPYVEGETLRGRLSRETQLSVEEAVRIATQVADALDYAHRHNVIHRDIKPENILLHDGRPMVADFGIALAVSAAAGGRMTETGLSLGTPHYMSPEQATAEKEITGRSDIYSLGSVLYEMLAGEPPHMGHSAQQIIMKIITDTARPVTELRKSVPPNVAAAVAKSLEKLPADRFESAKAFAEALVNRTFTSATFAGDVALGIGRGRMLTPAFLGVSAIAVVAVVVGAIGWLRSPPPPPVIRYELPLEPVTIPTVDLPAPTPAPDGSYLVFHGPRQDSPTGRQLWIKRRDAQVATPIAGTGGADSFALSPDGSSIAFTRSTSLFKVPIEGGEPISLASGTVLDVGGVAWLEDGSIVYSRLNGSVPELVMVSADGGEPATVASSAERNAAGMLPAPVWGTAAVLYAWCASVTSCDTWVLDLKSLKRQRLLSGVSFARFATTGHLVYVQGQRLMAVPFDRGDLTVSGQPVTLADGIGGFYPFSLGRSGTLVTRIGSGDVSANRYDMVWVDRSGRVTPVDTTWRFTVSQAANNHGWALSPDGTRLAIGLFTETGDDIWVKHLPRGALSRISFDSIAETRPRWSRDGRWVSFLSGQGADRVLRHRADGAGNDSLVLDRVVQEAMFSPDGKWLVFREGSVGAGRGGRDIRGMRVGGDTTTVPLIVTPFDEDAIAISPDSKWIAYQSDETGRLEVFIRSFPNTNDVKRAVSIGGGAAPLWSRDGRELFYVSADKDMMTARISAGDPITVAQPARLFRVPDELLAVEYLYYTPWDVAADGRFIMARIRSSTSVAASTMVVAENWLTELMARVPR